MNNPAARSIRIALAVLVFAGLAGCVSYYQPRYGGDGVYYDDAYYTPATVRSGYAVNPVYYPYWSLDYFYFSRYYHPYSVFVGYHDPFYYPYPGWYYGYRPGPRVAVSFHYGWGGYYPWYRYGDHYRHFQPWHFHGHYGFRGHSRHHYWDQPPVRRVDARLREMARRDVAAARGQDSVSLSNAARLSRAADRRAPDRRAIAGRGDTTRQSISARRAAGPQSRDSNRPVRGTDVSRLRGDVQIRNSRGNAGIRPAVPRASDARRSISRDDSARSALRRVSPPASRAARPAPETRPAPARPLRREAPPRVAPSRSERPSSDRSTRRSSRPAARPSGRSASRDRGSIRSGNRRSGDDDRGRRGRDRN